MKPNAADAIATSTSVHRNLHGQLLDALGLHIVTTPANPERLVAEAIGEQFGTSRTVVREAFRALEAKGLIRARPNSGTRILPQRCWSLLDPQVLAWRAQSPAADVQSRELAQISAVIEQLIARLAAERAAALPESDRERLAQLVDALSTAGQDGDHEAFAAADRAFHALLVQAAGSAVLEHLAVLLYRHLAPDAGALCAVDSASAAAHEALAAHVLAGEASMAESTARIEIATRRSGAHADAP